VGTVLSTFSMRRIGRCSVTFMILVNLQLFVSTSSRSAAEGQATDGCPSNRGWELLILPEQTTASNPGFNIGFGGVGDSHRYWRRWHEPGNPDPDPNRLQFPIEHRYATQIWIEGFSYEDGKKGSACVLYNGKPLQCMCFEEDQEAHEVSFDEEGETCGQCGC
jgi:hypothetical protein